MKKYFLFILLFVGVFAGFPRKSYAWGKETHKNITKHVALSSIIMGNNEFFVKLNLERGLEYQWLKRDGEIKNISGWMQYGAEREDGPELDVAAVRSSNHFHDPLKSFNSAGLTDIRMPIPNWKPLSLLLWAQDSDAQSNWLILEGDYSWKKVRDYFFQALTSDNGEERSKYFAEMFKGLGHQVHLIQDAAVPEHVRNDSHALNSVFWGWFSKTHGGIFRCIEGWAESENGQKIISDFASQNPLRPQVTLYSTASNPLVPIFHLVDYGVYHGSNPSNMMEQGLAEYTNANFVSEDTLLTENSSGSLHYFPYPRLTSTDIGDYVSNGVLPQQVQAADGKQDFIVYLKKDKDGEIINQFLRTNYFSILFRGNTERLKETLFTDHVCYNAAASMLIPRAVGYSAALIDYFFRNTNAIEISVPRNGIYAMDVPPDVSYPFGSGFSKLRLTARSIASDGVNFVNGEVKLVVSYRLGYGDVSDQFKNPPTNPEMRFSYITGTSSTPDPLDPSVSIKTIPREATEIEFDLSEPIPMNATDIRLMLVFKGNFENEVNNVAIGFKDIRDPTPIDFFNNMDKICLFNTWYDAGTDAAAAVVDSPDNGGNGDGIAREWDIRKHNMTNVCVRFSPAANGQKASFTDFDHRFERINAGEWRRIFILADSEFNISFATLIEPVPFGQHSTNWYSDYEPDLDLMPTINNSLEYLGYQSPNYGQPPVHMYLRHYSTFVPFRSIANRWALFTMHHWEYPADSTCADELLTATPLKSGPMSAPAQTMEDENGKTIRLQLSPSAGEISIQKAESRLQTDENEK